MGLKELRPKNNLTQIDIAKKLKVTQGAVAQWEKGLCSPTAKKLPQLAEILKCSIDDIFNERNDKNEYSKGGPTKN